MVPAAAPARVKFGWKPYPPFIAEGLGSRLRDVDGHEYIDYLLGLGPDDPRPPPPGGHRRRSSRRSPTWAPASGCPTSWRSRPPRRSSTPCPASRWCASPTRGSEAVGSAVRIARAVTGRRAHHPLRGASTTAGRTPCTGATTRPGRWPGRPTPRVRCRPVPACRPSSATRSIVLHVERRRELRAGDGRARRRGRRGHHRAGGVQHRLHPARARLPRAAARAETQKHGALLIFDEVITGFRLRARRRPGVVRRHART